MSTKFVAACIQNNATPDVDFNIETTLRLAREAAEAGAGLICTPEYFSGLRTENGLFHPAAFAEAEHPVLPAFARAARDWKVWFLLGSLGVLNRDGRISNRSYVLDSEGGIVARYNKVHMFDVVLDSGPLTESATIAPGGRSVVAHRRRGAGSACRSATTCASRRCTASSPTTARPCWRRRRRSPRSPARPTGMS